MKKVWAGIVLIVLIIFLSIVFYRYILPISVKKEIPQIIVEGRSIAPESSPMNIAPETGKYYSLRYKNETFDINLLNFSNNEESVRYLNEFLLVRIEDLSRNLSVNKSLLLIDKFPGYVYRSLQPKKTILILLKNNLILEFMSDSIDNTHIQDVLKWFIKTYTE